MAEYRGFRIPEDLHYDLGYHVWLKVEGELVAIGATDPAQAYAGGIIHIGVKKAGTVVKRGGILATIESAKFMGPMRSPVAGTVEEVNAEVAKKPSLVNGDAYAHWVVRLRPENLEADLAQLTSGAEAVEGYKPIIDEWCIEGGKG